MATPETTPSLERSVDPEVSRRVMLRLVSGDREPLSIDDAGLLSHKLRVAHRGRADYVVLLNDGDSLIDFWGTDLLTAVKRVDSALFSAGMGVHFANVHIDKALLGTDAVTEVTAEAAQIFDDHRQLLINQAVTHALGQTTSYELHDLLYDAATA